MAKSAHSIGTLVNSLNAKAAAAGEDIRVEHATLEQTWGDLCGVVITGTGNVERAVAYAKAYYTKHLAPQRCYDAQFAWHDRGVRNGKREIGLVYWPCAD